MSLLLIADVLPGVAPPEFGGELPGHLARKAHPQLLAASYTAWALLAAGLRQLGVARLPEVYFGPQGKPRFAQGLPCFSLSHSGTLATALISNEDCGVDIQQVRPELAQRMRVRCLSGEELRRGLDFFSCWTRKECIGKYKGTGIGMHPNALNTLDAAWSGRFLTVQLSDTSGAAYVLSALCADAATLQYQQVGPEALL